MPFSNIPKNSIEFENKFKYISGGSQKKVLELIIKVNRLYENNPGGVDIENIGDTSFLYYNGLSFVKSIKRNSGYYFHPTATFQKLLKSNNITKEILQKISNLSYNRGCDALFWEFLNNPSNIWVSALSQAYALELFSNNEKYSDVCKKIINSFNIDWEGGGVYDSIMNWYLEYPMYISGTRDLRRVLNGHVDVLLILYRYYKKTNNILSLNLFNRGLETLKKYLPKFVDERGRSFYSYWQATHRNKQIVERSYNEKYHNIHVNQLWRIYTITNDIFFKNYVDRMMKVPNPNIYYLTPYNVDIINQRVPQKCCPNCKKIGVCKGCEI